VTDDVKILKEQIDDLKKNEIDPLLNNLNQHSLRPILQQNESLNKKSKCMTGNNGVGLPFSCGPSLRKKMAQIV
jgi:hypothetical protein